MQRRMRAYRRTHGSLHWDSFFLRSANREARDAAIRFLVQRPCLVDIGASANQVTPGNSFDNLEKQRASHT